VREADAVIGPILMVVALLVVLPVSILMLAGLGTAAFGAALNKNSEDLYADHELTPLNR
jgi:hypothetical protein